MKKLLSLIMSAAILLSAAGALPSAAADDISYSHRDVTAYLFAKDKTVTMTCLFRDDLPGVPYLSAVDYLNQLYTVPFNCVQHSDGTFSVSDQNGEMIVDVDRDTIHFDDYELFADSDAKPYLETETADYLLDDSDYEALGEVNPVDLSLADYGVDLTAYNKAVYLPLPVLNDVFAGTYHAALYLDGALYFADVMADEQYYDDGSLFDSVSRDKALVDYSYRELCFVMDHFYGCPPKAQLAQSIRDKGFDQAVAGYNSTAAEAKRLMLSDDLVDYCYGLLYLDMYLDDGGHTMLSYGLQMALEDHPHSAFSTSLSLSLYDVFGRLGAISTYLMDQMEEQSAREKAEDSREQFFGSMTEVKKWGEDAAFYCSGSTGVFTFDEFKDAIVEDFKWSLDYAAENGITDFVIDLSLNSGGSTAVVVYILSVACDYSRMDMLYCLSGNRYYVDYTVDKNLDGQFDAKDDEVKYNLRFGVLTSRFSFSAANALPCLLQYNGIPVIGEASGGGTCAVSIHYDPAGYAYAISDSMTMIYPDGSLFDEGAQPDCPLPASDANYDGYYDLAKISEGIDSYYASHPMPTTPSPPTVPSPSGTEAAAPVDPAPSAAEDAPAARTAMPVLLWWILAAVIAAVAVLAGVLVVLIIRRKKQNME